MILTAEMIRKAKAMLEAQECEPPTVFLHKSTEYLRAEYEAAGYLVVIQQPLPALFAAAHEHRRAKLSKRRGYVEPTA